METLYPNSYIPNFNWLMQESISTKWTREDNKKFERALAIVNKDAPDKWTELAAMIPGKSPWDVMNQYEKLEADVIDIEAGVVPLPVYMASSFTLELVDNRGFHALRRKASTGRSSDQERKKGVPWTEIEHRRFLMGLQQHGKGDWRNISRNFVVTKTPTQVASHAQKYFARQLSEGKEKRRPSIHDITTVHLADSTHSDNNRSPSIDDKSALIPQPRKSSCTPKVLLDWNHRSDGGAVMVFDSTNANPFMAYPREVASRGLKMQMGVSHGADIGPMISSGFPIQSTRYQVHR